MYDLNADSVWQLVVDVLRSGIIDEVDLARDVRPFMAAVVRIGLDWDVMPAAILETYRAARQAVDHLGAERARKQRAPAREWSQPDVETIADDPGVLHAMFSGRRAST